MSAMHADLSMLLAYWQREMDPAQEAAFEEHYLGCEVCSARLAEVEAIASGVQRAFASGQIGTFVTPAYAEALRTRGLKLREYHVPRNGSVNCSVAPSDDVLVSRMEVPLEGVERVDAIALFEGEHRLEDVPFDPGSGEVVMLPSIRFIRTLPAHSQSVRLVAVGAEGDRVLGEYTFNHSPHRP